MNQIIETSTSDSDTDSCGQQFCEHTQWYTSHSNLRCGVHQTYHMPEKLTKNIPLFRPVKHVKREQLIHDVCIEKERVVSEEAIREEITTTGRYNRAIDHGKEMHVSPSIMTTSPTIGKSAEIGNVTYNTHTFKIDDSQTLKLAGSHKSRFLCEENSRLSSKETSKKNIDDHKLTSNKTKEKYQSSVDNSNANNYANNILDKSNSMLSVIDYEPQTNLGSLKHDNTISTVFFDTLRHMRVPKNIQTIEYGKMETLGIGEDVHKCIKCNIRSQKYNNSQSNCKEFGPRLITQNFQHPYTLDELSRAQGNKDNNQTNCINCFYFGQINDQETTKNGHMKNKAEENHQRLQYERTKFQSKEDFLVENYQQNSKDIIKTNENVVECNEKEFPDNMKVAVNDDPLQSKTSEHRVANSMSIEQSNPLKKTAKPTNWYMKKLKFPDERLDQTCDCSKMQFVSTIEIPDNVSKELPEVKKSVFNEWASETEEITDDESPEVDISKPVHNRKRLVLKYLNEKCRHCFKRGLESKNGQTALQKMSETRVVSIVEGSEIQFLERAFNSNFENCKNYYKQKETALPNRLAKQKHNNKEIRCPIIPNMQSYCNKEKDCVLKENIQNQALNLTKSKHDDFKIIGRNTNMSYDGVCLPIEHKTTSIETDSNIKYAGNKWCYQRKDQNACIETLTLDSKTPFTSDNPNVFSIKRNDRMRNIFAHAEPEPSSSVHMINNKPVLETQWRANMAVQGMDPYVQRESEPVP